MEIKITFPGGKKVNAELDGMVIPTDQPVRFGGEGSAPAPFTLFLASIGTCAGIYILGFCQERGIPTDRITLSQRMEHAISEGKSSLSKIIIDIRVPGDFPEKYREAVKKVAEQCAVKKAVMNPPAFEINTVVV